MSVKKILQSVVALIAFGVASSAHALEFNMPKGVTPISHDVYFLHMLIFWICVVIGVLVFGVMIYSLIRHRKSRGAEAANFHENTTVEVTWTIVPFIILIVVAVASSGTLLEISDTSNSDLTVKVTGYQWLWEYNYLDNDVDIYSRMSKSSNLARRLNPPADSPGPYDVKHYLRSVDNPFVVPVDKKIRLLITSGDVIHSWWVPDMGMKKDAIPGYINEMWIKVEKPGVYTGQCAELCGRGHAYMPIVVKAVPQAQFQAWIKQQGGHLAKGASHVQTTAPQQTGSAQSTSLAADQTRQEAQTAKTPSPAGNDETAQAQESTTTAAATAVAGTAAKQAQADGQQAATAVTDAAGKAIEQAKTTAQQAGQAAGDVVQAAAEKTKAVADKAGTELSKAKLMAEGKAVYASHCAVCHQADGTGNPPVFPDLTTAPVVTGPIPAHIQQVLQGGKIMPPFNSSLDNQQIAAVVTFERNAFGNTGDVVQPADVQAQR